jgi:hypothetical protein
MGNDPFAEDIVTTPDSVLLVLPERSAIFALQWREKMKIVEDSILPANHEHGHHGSFQFVRHLDRTIRCACGKTKERDNESTVLRILIKKYREHFAFPQTTKSFFQIESLTYGDDTARAPQLGDEVGNTGIPLFRTDCVHGISPFRKQSGGHLPAPEMRREENDALSPGEGVSKMFFSMNGDETFHLSFHLRKPEKLHDTASYVPIGAPHDMPCLGHSHSQSPDAASFRAVHTLLVPDPQQCSQHLTDPESSAVRQVIHQSPHNTKHLPNCLPIHP